MKKYIKSDVTDLMEESYQTKLDLARNPATRPAALLKLARDPQQQVRLFVTFNPNTPAEALSILAQDKDTSVRRGVAEHLNTSVETLRHLAEDDAGRVLVGVATNPNTPSDVLENLYQRRIGRGYIWEEKDMLAAIARNSNSSFELQEAAQDSFEGLDRNHKLIEVWFDLEELNYGNNRQDISRIITSCIESEDYKVYCIWFDHDDTANPEDGYLPDCCNVECDWIASHRDSRLIEKNIYTSLGTLGLRSIEYMDENEI